ncbi:hypothetical protein PM082_008947 [Marasmius tenuissimus]|nr:hypothetical protein PM082_008947 [Marasmius tenuissimus]
MVLERIAKTNCYSTCRIYRGIMNTNSLLQSRECANASQEPTQSLDISYFLVGMASSSGKKNPSAGMVPGIAFGHTPMRHIQPRPEPAATTGRLS